MSEDCVIQTDSNFLESAAAKVGALPSDAAGSRSKILLVEDNVFNQKMAVATLARMGFSADTAGSGEEAVQKLETGAYDLILMDVQMPGMDGYGTTRLIRKAENHRFDPNVPIIAMTANAMVEDRVECLRSGMNDYITKPINPQELLTAIEKQLSMSADAVKITHTAGCEEIKDSEIFNRQDLLHRIGDDESALEGFIAMFLKDGTEQTETG